MNSTAEIEITEAPGRGATAVLRVRGRLDASTAPTLLQRCALVQANGQNLVLNLSGVSFLGSSGVGAMLVLVEQFQEQAGAIHFASPSDAARSVIDLLDLGPYLTLHATEDEAVAALEG
jgi:anti-sigma B factor antagonist